MGGRGTYANGKNVRYTYKTSGKIKGIKVLTGLNGKHSLPEESHSSWAYIKLNPDGTFREMRLYNKEHKLRYELAYHREGKIGHKDKPVLHYHTYDDNFNRTTHRMPKAMRKHFKKYFVGVKI